MPENHIYFCDRWEKRVYCTGSVKWNFTERCMASIPSWMGLPRRRLPWPRTFRPYHEGPKIEWRTGEVPEFRRRCFYLFAHKVLTLEHIGRCGFCGTTRRRHRAVWGLNARVCQDCWVQNSISHRTLLQVCRRRPRLVRRSEARPRRTTALISSSRTCRSGRCRSTASSAARSST